MGGVASSVRSVKDELWTSAAGDVYQPRRDPYSGDQIKFTGQKAPEIDILPKAKAYAPSMGEEPDQSMFDVNSVGCDTVNDTRRQLKSKFFSSRDRLVGKQLTTLAAYEDIYEFSKEYLGTDFNQTELISESPLGVRLKHLQQILKDVFVQMSSIEHDPTRSVLDSFKEAIGNHLVQDLDPYDAAQRKDATLEIVLCASVTWETADQMLKTALMNRAKVFTNSLLPTIYDKDTEKAAMATIRVETNCTDMMARTLLERAIRGEFKNVEAEMNKQDYACESVAMNKKKLTKYVALLDWWEAQREGEANPVQDDDEDKGICSVPDSRDLTGESLIKAYIAGKCHSIVDAALPLKDELARLTHNYDQVETKWRIYLNLSIQNEVGEGPTLFTGSGKGKRMNEAKLLREDVRKEFFEAVKDMIEPVLESQDDIDEIGSLLKDLEKVELETDNYVSRLEANLQYIAVEEESQVNDLNIAGQQIDAVMGQLDNVNAMLADNLGRMQNLEGNGAAIMRLVVVIGICVAVIIGAFVLQKF